MMKVKIRLWKFGDSYIISRTKKDFCKKCDTNFGI